MSAAEIGWRVRGKLRETVDGLRLSMRAKPPALSAVADVDGSVRSCLERGAALLPFPPVGKVALPPAAIEQLVAEADKLCDHRFSFFALHDVPMGETIQWNREYNAARDIPLVYAPKIDYRDYAEAGDCKYAWEPSRHAHLVTLGRAYRATGDERYAREIVEQIDSWIDQCPFDRGMQWRSPMELSIRMINWVWALELIRPSAVLTDDVLARYLPLVHLHCRKVDRCYSRYSSANNHTIGEAAGVLVASLYFPFMNEACRWRERSRALLAHAMEEQTFPDGVNREQATGYHFFVLEFFLLAGLLARRAGHDFPTPYWEKLERMFAFVAALAATGAPPLFGDCDDGYVVAVGDELNDPASFLPVGAVLYNRPSFKALAPTFSRRAVWLLGDEGRAAFEALPDAAAHDRLGHDVPLAFPDAGYYILRDRAAASPPPLAVMFDCGNLGFRSIAAHGHADALSLTVSAHGDAVLVDPGTYDYFTYRAWRRYFRSTRAHNTVVIDGQDQSEMIGLFLWGRRAEARCEQWEPGDTVTTVSGAHDGYRRLADPVTHRRAVQLDAGANRVRITDTVEAAGSHAVEIRFHFAAHCRIEPAGDHRYTVMTPKARLTLTLDAALKATTYKGSEDPICGWESRSYHHREPAVSLVGRARTAGQASFTSSLALCAAEA